MVNEITLEIPDEALAAELKDCKVGEEKTLTFTVTDAQPGSLSGDVKSIEGYGDDAEESDEPTPDNEAEEPPSDSGSMGRKMPKAIVMIGAGK